MLVFGLGDRKVLIPCGNIMAKLLTFVQKCLMILGATQNETPFSIAYEV